MIEELFEDLTKTPIDHQEEYDNARMVRAKCLRLKENEDFKWLTNVMQSNLDQRVRDVFKATSGLDSALTNLFNQAEIRGFQAAMLFIEAMQNGAESTMASSSPYVKKED